MQKVLLVEDDLFIQEIFLRTFKKKGYDIVIAKDGEDGIQKAKAADFDVILLDIMLPKMNGIDVLRVLRTSGAKAINTPIFVFTNLGQDDVMKEAFEIGADGYFIKAQMDASAVIVELEKFFKSHKNLPVTS